jgi:hypothetical protein
MTNQDHKAILGRAIKKAISNGWQPYEGIDSSMLAWDISRTRVIFRYKDIAPLGEHSWYGMMFSHEFAKALWGEEREWNVAGREEEDGSGYSGYVIPYWQGMLQQMVVAKDRIAYLASHLPVEESE